MLLCFRGEFFPVEKLPVDAAVAEYTISFRIQISSFWNADPIVMKTIFPCSFNWSYIFDDDIDDVLLLLTS